MPCIRWWVLLNDSIDSSWIPSRRTRSTSLVSDQNCCLIASILSMNVHLQHSVALFYLASIIRSATWSLISSQSNLCFTRQTILRCIHYRWSRLTKSTLSISFKVRQRSSIVLAKRTKQSTHAWVSSHQCLVVDDGVLHNLLHQQITSLYIDLTCECAGESSTEYNSKLFHSILQSCPRLTKLHFCPGTFSWVHMVEFSRLNCQSALLTDLSVYTTSFGECAYLFDGHFPSLSTVTIVVQEIGCTAGCRVKAVSIIRCRKNDDTREICLFCLEMFAQLKTFLLVFV